jgi:hypothetical protein
MTFEESLNDVSVRERQLAAHILRSPEYLQKADQELKRQVTMLYLAIALLMVIVGFFTLRAVGKIPPICVELTDATSLLAIVNCLLLIRTKTWLNRLNEAWLAPHERDALNTLKIQRNEIITSLPRSRAGNENAELN